MILRPLNKKELEGIFDQTAIEVLNYFMKTSLFSQPERVEGQPILPIQVPKEHIEQWVVQAIGAKPVGAGNYAVDVIKPHEFGADVKMLSCKVNKYGELANSDSGETSLAQKFTDSGTNLDYLFKEKLYDEIVDGWKKILYEKLNKVIQAEHVENIYYIFILRANTKFYLCAMEVDINEIVNMQPRRGTEASVFVNGLIDEHFGNGKIYKAKKRLELRLRPKHWVEKGFTLEFDLDFNTPACDIRKLIEKGQLNNQAIAKFDEVVINNSPLQEIATTSNVFNE